MQVVPTDIGIADADADQAGVAQTQDPRFVKSAPADSGGDASRRDATDRPGEEALSRGMKRVRQTLYPRGATAVKLRDVAGYCAGREDGTSNCSALKGVPSVHWFDQMARSARTARW
jgi:hypothetical protein